MTNRKIIRILSLTLICAVLFTIGFGGDEPVYAGSAVDANNAEIAVLTQTAARIAQENRQREDRIAGLRNNINQQEEFISEVNTQIDQINAQITAYRNLIDVKQAAIEKTQREIELKEQEILNTQTRIEQREHQIRLLDAQNDANIERFGQIAAQMYMNSESDTISLLTGSASFFDVLVRAEMIRNIGEKNTEFMNDLLEAIERQNIAIAELEVEKADLETERIIFMEQQTVFEGEMQQLQADRAAVAEEVERQYGTLYSLTAERDDLQSSVNNIRGQVNAASAELEGINLRVAELEATNQRIEAEIRRRQAEANRPDFSADGFIWPLERRFNLVTCYFGFDPWRNGQHNGVDIGNSGINGANIFAMRSGTVITVVGGWGGGYGTYVVIDHGGGYSTLYAHMTAGSAAVSVGDFVSQGDTIGRVGNTGWSTGPHLHFEIRRNGTAVNPLGYVSVP
jgi:murein DD-endopeptidase MepM/ murein hydrolase activator NlpD